MITTSFPLLRDNVLPSFSLFLLSFFFPSFLAFKFIVNFFQIYLFLPLFLLHFFIFLSLIMDFFQPLLHFLHDELLIFGLPFLSSFGLLYLFFLLHLPLTLLSFHLFLIPYSFGNLLLLLLHFFHATPSTIASLISTTRSYPPRKYPSLILFL